MKTLAAVLTQLGKPLVLAELEIPALKSGQVLVEVAFSGVCHTQILECRGYRGEDRFLPHCLGHEGSGVIVETGPDVRKVQKGDSVILSWMKGSGAEVNSTTYRWGEKTVNAGAITTFSRLSVISENRLTPLPAKVPLSQAAMLGCAIPTGVGIVRNVARAQPGQSIAIFGTGGIGLCALAGAIVAGCKPIIAIDVRPERLELAKKMGATYTLDAARMQPRDEILRICSRGVDFAVESSGIPEVMREALACVRNQGGAAVIAGNARHGEMLEIDPHELNLGKRLLGTWGGDNRPDQDFPQYIEWLQSGKLKIDPILSEPYPLSRINDAINDLEEGNVARPLIDLKLA